MRDKFWLSPDVVGHYKNEFGSRPFQLRLSIRVRVFIVCLLGDAEKTGIRYHYTQLWYIYWQVITKKLNLSVTLSSSIKHNPAAIWAHLDPVMKDILTLYPDVTTVHFCSDGPFSQYRQKQNFYLSSTLTFNYGFKAMTWSFFKAGHGKGPADGIGGYLKRSADDMVARGPDISNADNFYECLKDVSKIKLFMISQEDIQNIENHIPSTLQTHSGTRKLHQIFSKDHGKLHYRNLSCFCKRGFCDTQSVSAST
ncbi:hypothetical protein ACJJTC_009503 [Scirpophaga incertulas]